MMTIFLALLTNAKKNIFRGDIEVQFDLDKCSKVTFRKCSLVKSKTWLDINSGNKELENNKIYKYLEINEKKDIL